MNQSIGKTYLWKEKHHISDSTYYSLRARNEGLKLQTYNFYLLQRATDGRQESNQVSLAWSSCETTIELNPPKGKKLRGVLDKWTVSR